MLAIVLTTPHVYDPGHGAVPFTSAHVLLTNFHSDTLHQCMALDMQYGNWANGIFSPSTAPTDTYRIVDTPEAQGFDDQGQIQTIPATFPWSILVGTTLIAQEQVNTQLYIAVGSNLLQYLISQGRYVGTVQDLP